MPNALLCSIRFRAVLFQPTTNYSEEIVLRIFFDLGIMTASRKLMVLQVRNVLLQGIPDHGPRVWIVGAV